MSKPAFTEGPWRTDEDCGHESVSGPDGAMVADCSIFVSPKFGERRTQTNRANARLIAAAPDMVEALTKLEAALRKDSRDKTVLSDTVEYHLDGQVMYQAINCARAALAKALGESSQATNGA